MRYETVAEAYRVLEQASGRLALTGRLAALLAAAPAGLLPVVCYLCQGLIAAATIYEPLRCGTPDSCWLVPDHGGLVAIAATVAG